MQFVSQDAIKLSGHRLDGMDNMGRPRTYNTEEDLEEAIDTYFKSLIGEESVKIPTMAGLAYELGFASRQSLYEYEQDSRFSYILKRARLFIESCYEARMAGNSPTGAIFWLKNHGGYTDKQEQTIQGGDNPVTVKIEYV